MSRRLLFGLSTICILSCWVLVTAGFGRQPARGTQQQQGTQQGAAQQGTQQGKGQCPAGQTCPPATTQGPPAAGGPGGGAGPVIIPKQQPPATPPPPPPEAAPPPQRSQYQYSINVPDVEIPVSVEGPNGDFIPGLDTSKFALWEDNVPQKVTKVSLTTEAPMTVVMLVEFRQAWRPLLYTILNTSYIFTGQLQPQDWVALMTFDLKPTVVVDFTHDKRAIQAGIQSLNFADFMEADTFDAVTDAVDRLESLQGHKTILLIGTGLNTFSHSTWDQVQKKLKVTQGVSIDAVSINGLLQTMTLQMGDNIMMTQANNEMRYMAELTGGRYYEPRFEGALNQTFQDLAAAERNQYIVSYIPTNKALDGTFRKIKIGLVDTNGQPLKMVDQKGKALKYELNYRNGYTSRHVVE